MPVQISSSYILKYLVQQKLALSLKCRTLIFNFQGTTLKCLSSGGDAKLYRCEFCSVPFSTIRSLNMHKTKSHGPNMTSKEFSKPLEIDIGKIKSEKLDLDSYMKKQYSMESTKDKCSFCHVRFTTKQTMKVNTSYLDYQFRFLPLDLKRLRKKQNLNIFF